MPIFVYYRSSVIAPSFGNKRTGLNSQDPCVTPFKDMCKGVSSYT